MELVQKYLKITQEDFRKVCEISHRVWNSFSSIFGFARLAKFRTGCGIHFSQSCFLSCSLYSFWHFACYAKISHSHEIFLHSHAMRNCWMLDFFYDSFPCILDWFGKGYEVLQNLDSSCVWALTCFAMDYTKFSLILGSF